MDVNDHYLPDRHAVRSLESSPLGKGSRSWYYSWIWGTQRLARLVSPGMAKQMIYTARNIKADEAYRIGLVNAVYPQEELMDAAKKMASGIAKNAPIAVRNCKKAINEGLQVNMDEAIVIEEKLFGDCFETEDQKAGMGNFLEKDKEKKLKVVPFKNC